MHFQSSNTVPAAFNLDRPIVHPKCIFVFSCHLSQHHSYNQVRAPPVHLHFLILYCLPCCFLCITLFLLFFFPCLKFILFLLKYCDQCCKIILCFYLLELLRFIKDPCITVNVSLNYIHKSLCTFLGCLISHSLIDNGCHLDVTRC
jgi:hypothetical protein